MRTGCQDKFADRKNLAFHAKAGHGAQGGINFQTVFGPYFTSLKPYFYVCAKWTNAFLVWIWGFLLNLSPRPYNMGSVQNLPIKWQILLFHKQRVNIGTEIQTKLWLILHSLRAGCMWAVTREALMKGRTQWGFAVEYKKPGLIVWST